MQQIILLLSTAPLGMGGSELLRLIVPAISQATMSRMLGELSASGQLVKTGAARATRYLATGDRRELAVVRSRLVHQEIAKRLAREPELRRVAIRRLEMLRRTNPGGRHYHDQWGDLLKGVMPALLRTLCELSEHADDLRKESPFTTLLPQSERNRLFRDLAR